MNRELEEVCVVAVMKYDYFLILGTPQTKWASQWTHLETGDVHQTIRHSEQPNGMTIQGCTHNSAGAILLA